MPDKKSKVKTPASPAGRHNSKRSKEEKTGGVGLRADVHGVDGKKVGTMLLPKEIFGVKVNEQLMAQAVRAYLVNQRRGTASTKTRGEVQGSTRKIYRQKGTGRARHGSIRAPIFVHGGIVFGPKPRDFSLLFPKKMRRRALFSSLSAKLAEGNVRIVRGLGTLGPKTKEMATALHKVSVNGKSSRLLLVLPKSLEQVSRAARNIEGVTFTQASQLTAYEVLQARILLFMQEAIPVLESTFLREKEKI